MKIFAYDLETTGTNPAQNSIHQIAGIIYVNGKEKERFEIKMQPNPKAKIDRGAFNINRDKTEEEIDLEIEKLKTYMTFEEGYRALIKILAAHVDKYDKKDKFFLLGYNNAGFDDNFLRGLFLQNEDKYFGSWFWADPLDVRVLAIRQLAAVRPSMENFQLKTVARKVGIEVDESKLHDAVYDVELTVDIFHRLRLTKAEVENNLKEFEFRSNIKRLAVEALSKIAGDTPEELNEILKLVSHE